MNQKNDAGDKVEIIEIPIVLDNADGDSKAIIHLKRTLFSNDDEFDNITIVWNDSHCYYNDLSDVQRYFVLNAIHDYDKAQVKKTL